MHDQYLTGLAAILVVGMAARWIAWELRLPSILLLLLAGIVAGPVTGWLRPDELFGEAFVPLVSISVGVILFEGGLSLSFRELRDSGNIVRNLVTIGALTTWVITATGAYLILRMDFALSVLIGAILVVTGPTVVIPLLNHVRPKGRISTIIRWEGILIDPVGALLAVLVYEAILAGSFTGHAEAAGLQFLGSIASGVIVGGLAAVLVIVTLKYYLLPDYLQNPFSLTVVVAAFAISNLLRPESGLLATTFMGIVLANQHFIPVKEIVEFKENLRVLVISSLFILLAARLKVSDLATITWRSWAFLAVLIFIARPVSVSLSCLGSDLGQKEREFLSWMAPRGIVAAAVASLFAERLGRTGVEGAEQLVPLTFLVIIGTVTLYGFTAFPLARKLGLAEPSPQGVLFVGAHSWAREMANCLRNEGFETALADSNWQHVTEARLAGLKTYFGGILSEPVLERIDLYGIGRLLALTSNDEANSLAALHFRSIFSRKEVYQLPPKAGREATRKLVSPLYLSGRFLFADDMSYDVLTRRFALGATIKKSNLTKQFDWQAFQERYGGNAVPLFLINSDRELTVVTATNPPKPKPGDTVLALVDAPAEHDEPAPRGADEA